MMERAKHLEFIGLRAILCCAFSGARDIISVPRRRRDFAPPAVALQDSFQSLKCTDPFRGCLALRLLGGNDGAEILAERAFLFLRPISAQAIRTTR